MTKRIAIVGTGPMGIYSLQQIVQTEIPLEITLFEKGSRAGIGMPYSPDNANKAMLANIASIEIPPVMTTYLEWLQAQPQDKLAGYGLDTKGLHDRQFTPRLLLGEYFRDQLMALVAAARQRGHIIHIHEDTQVDDIVAQPDGLTVTTEHGTDDLFDKVILATGHQFPDDDEASRSYFPSPWSGLIEAAIPATRVGIMGTSLSSIDAAMAVANQHGHFRHDDDDLQFDLQNKDLRITLMSRTGILPEADFYCPLPYQPLTILTEEAVAACAASDAPLDNLFDLVREEIKRADPAYALRIGLGGLDADSFADAYFAEREAADPFKWARSNLTEVERNKDARITVPWRYALLRMHERVEDIVHDLSDSDRDRFDTGMKKVFVDNYAAVPSESIRRILALRDAGVLSIKALGQDYDMSREADQTQIKTAQGTEVYQVFIDARGQKPLASQDIPFPSLRKALLASGHEFPDVAEDYSLIDTEGYSGRIAFGSIPYLMHDRPFVQGITACAEIATAIGRGINTGRKRRRVS